MRLRFALAMIGAPRKVCARVSAWLTAQPGWTVIGLTESPILGPKGNKEFFIAARFEPG